MSPKKECMLLIKSGVLCYHCSDLSTIERYNGSKEIPPDEVLNMKKNLHLIIGYLLKDQQKDLEF